MTTIITTDPAPQERPRRADDPPRKWFDPTVNLGHILSIGAMFLAGLFAWNKMDTRVLLLEVAQASQRERDASQDNSSKESMQQVKEAITKLDRTVEKLGDKLESKK